MRKFGSLYGLRLTGLRSQPVQRGQPVQWGPRVQWDQLVQQGRRGNAVRLARKENAATLVPAAGPAPEEKLARRANGGTLVHVASLAHGVRRVRVGIAEIPGHRANQGLVATLAREGNRGQWRKSPLHSKLRS